jgi:hypothetical protein
MPPAAAVSTPVAHSATATTKRLVRADASQVGDTSPRVHRTPSIDAPLRPSIEFGGQFESSEPASRLLFWLALGVVAAMFVMLASLKGLSSREPGVVRCR